MCDSNERSSSSGGCGFGGDCVNGACVCQQGWTKSSEFSFEPVKDLTRNETTYLLCDHNNPLLAFFYSVALLSVIIGIIAYCASAKKKSQRKRLVPYFITTSASAIFCAVKLLSSEKSITDDIEQAVFFAIAMFLSLVSSIVMLIKYIQLQYKAYALYHPQFLKYFNLLKLAAAASIGLAFVAMVLIITVPLVTSDRNKAKKIIQAALAIYAISTLFGPATALIVLSKLLDVIKLVMTKEECILPAQVMKRVRNLVLISGAQTFFFFFPAAFSNTWLRLQIYLVPLSVVCFTVISIGILSATLKLKRRSTKSKSPGITTTVLESEPQR